MGLSPQQIKEHLLNSDLPISLVLMDIFDEADPKDFPPAYNEKGQVRMKHNLHAAKVYHTFCPLHSEQRKGDSFAVFTQKKSVKCFNGKCSLNEVHLNLIDCVSVFVFKLDPTQLSNLDISAPYFWKSVRWLIQKYGTLLNLTLQDVETDGSKEDSEAQKEVAIHRIRKAAVDYYQWRLLKTQQGDEARKYLWETRGLQYGQVDSVEEIIEKYKLGLAVSDYQNPKLYHYLLKKGFKKEEILASKVCNEYDGKVVDAFKAKFRYITFPTIYRNRYGTIAGRNIDPSCKEEDRHYKLHGHTELPAGMETLHEAESFLLVEGEMDKVSVFALGHPHVMEARGTNGLNDEYIDMMAEIRKRNPKKCRTCYMIYDPDAPGKAAASKTGRKLVNIGIEVLVVRLPVVNGKHLDPNDLLKVYKEQAVDIFQQCLQESLSYDAFQVLYQLEGEELGTLSSARMAIKRCRHHIDAIPKDERMFIMEEVLLHLEKSGIPRDRLSSLLEAAWFGGIPSRSEDLNPGLEEAVQHSWLMVTDDLDVYTLWKHELKLPNAVRVLDAEVFVDKLKNSPIAKNITFDQKMETKTGQYLKDQLKTYNLTVFERPATFNGFDLSHIPSQIRHI